MDIQEGIDKNDPEYVELMTAYEKMEREKKEKKNVRYYRDFPLCTLCFRFNHSIEKCHLGTI